MRLSKRLRTIAELVTVGNRLADVGTDHGFIPIWLLEEKRIPGAIAMDINIGPLERARAHVKEAGLEDRIELRQSDGLDALQPGEADTILIAGMGGPLMIEILKRGDVVAKRASELLLSPHSDWAMVRRYLAESGFCISGEEMLKEDGKFYLILQVRPGEMEPWDEAAYRYGKRLIERKHPVLAEYLEKQLRTYERILAQVREGKAEGNETLIRELSEKTGEIRRVQKRMEADQNLEEETE